MLHRCSARVQWIAVATWMQWPIFVSPCGEPSNPRQMRDYFKLVTFSHTVFALPFALIGFTLGTLDAGRAPSWTDLLLVIGCMVFARSAAMAFNRLIDAGFDAANARTAVREVPAGVISRRAAGGFVALNALLFVLCAGLLNPLCLALSPVALAVVLGYSYTKRFTWLCHVVLGVGLALAPIGAYVAVTGNFSTISTALGGVVLLWVAGFDIVYALQDMGFDRSMGLQSVPARFGESRSLWLARALHVSCLILLIVLTVRISTHYDHQLWLLWGSVAVFGAALVWQHRLVRPGDLSRIDRAFFTTNGTASVVYAIVLVAALIWV